MTQVATPRGAGLTDAPLVRDSRSDSFQWRHKYAGAVSPPNAARRVAKIKRRREVIAHDLVSLMFIAIFIGISESQPRWPETSCRDGTGPQADRVRQILRRPDGGAMSLALESLDR